jgi:HSP20 family protein
MGPIVRWEPMTALGRLREEMNRLIEDFFGEPTEARAPMMLVPHVDLIDRPDELVARFELPGISKDQLQVDVSGDTLLVRGEVREAHEDTEGTYMRRERHVGAFQRAIPLPVEVKPNEVKAVYTDGVLEVTLPKSEQARAQKPTRIQIE